MSKDYDDTIKSMVKELKKHKAEPEYIYFPEGMIKTKDLKKYVKFLKKEMVIGFDIPKKALFGKEKHIKRYDKKCQK